MSKIKVLSVLTIPPPYNGQSVGNLNCIEAIKSWTDLTNINPRRNAAKKSWAILYGFVDYLSFLIKYRNLKKKCSYSILYLVPSPSFLGGFRDVLFLSLLSEEKRVILHLRNANYIGIFKSFYSPLASRISRRKEISYIVLSDGLKEQLSKYVSQEKISVVENWIDAEVEPSSEEFETSIISRGKRKTIRFTFVSNFLEGKGYYELLNALEILSSEGCESWHCTFIGRWKSAQANRAFTNQISQTGLQRRITLLQNIESRELLKKHYLECHCFVLPTYYDKEAQPRSIIEAMSCGNIVVSTFHASIPEVVNNGVTGFLVEPRDVAALAKALKHVYFLKDWKEMARASRQEYESKFSRKALTQKFEKVFETN